MELAVRAEVESLLRDLHERRRWLDMMIQGLEAAVESPEHRLIALAQEAFEDGQTAVHSMELGRGKRATLVSLAQSVSSTPQARRNRSQAART
ncbi:MAG: hypothetical protein R2748_31755 [Bryobacterales bacterium]